MNLDSNQSFHELLQNLRDNDEVAVQQVVEESTALLIDVAKRQIGEQLGRRIDPEDVVQSTYRSLFGRLRDGQYQLDDCEDLWKLLVTLTLNKVRRKARFHTAARRNIRNESDVPIANLKVNRKTATPSVEDTAIFIDTVNHFFATISPREREVLELRLQGYSSSEIAERTGRAQRSVRRILQHSRTRLESMLKE